MPVCFKWRLEGKKLPQTILTKKHFFMFFNHLPLSECLSQESVPLIPPQFGDVNRKQPELFPLRVRGAVSQPSAGLWAGLPSGPPRRFSECSLSLSGRFALQPSQLPAAGTQDSGAYYFTTQLSLTAERVPGDNGGLGGRKRRGTFYRPAQQILCEVLFYI